MVIKEGQSRQIKSITDVQWERENPNPWEKRLAEFPTGAVDPKVGIFL